MNSFTLRSPIITEKTYALSQDKVYTFLVDPKATKGQIKDAVEQTFGVTVTDVHTTITHGKMKRSRTRQGASSRSTDKKKAFVRIKKDQTIELFEVNE